MIVKEHATSYDRLSRFCLDPMLMLGKQANPGGYRFPVPYATLDPDGGDYALDISADVHTDIHGDDAVDGPLLRRFGTVFDLGTLEHVWDTHTAYINAAECVRPDGYFLGQAPVAGWEGHGIHITSDWAIRDFFTLNGFVLLDTWYTTQAGGLWVGPIGRNAGKSILLWYVARRDTVVDRWQKPSQVYANGVKPSR